jgi:hypothetical protein
MARRRWFLRGGLLAGALAMAACSPKFDIPLGAQIPCGANGECPEGTVCQTSVNLCVSTENLGSEPPALAEPATVTPTYGNTQTQFTVSFDSTKALIRPPDVWAELRDRKLTLTLDTAQSSGNHYVFHYQPVDGDPEGVALLFVKLVDQVGNVADGLSAGTLVIDLTAPQVIFPKVDYLPLDTNRLGSDVTAAGVGTRIRVKVTASEPLDPTSEPSLSATNGVQSLDFTTVAVDETGAEFEVTVPSGQSDAPSVYVPSLSGWKDAAGNIATASQFTDPAIVVRTTPPTLDLSQDDVEYLRSPTGGTAAETLASGVTLPAGPYFALAPLDPLGGPATLPARTFRREDGSAPTRVLIWADDQRETLLGAMRPSADGTWPRLQLAALDSSVAFATLLDEAGNESDPPVPLKHAEWVATLRDPAFSDSAHRLTGTSVATAARQPDPDRAFTRTGTSAQGMDADSVLQRAEVAWRERTVVAAGPVARTSAAMAYDGNDGGVYLFGGETSSGLQDELWRWDGVRWAQIAKQRTWPAARKDSGLVYDATRNRLVLFGGAGSDGALDDLWEWDGSAWTQVAKSGAWPRGRNLAGLTYDSARGSVILFGGYTTTGIDDPSVWEWDGAAWQEHPSDGTGPGARFAAALSYDPNRGRVVLFGGYDPTSACGNVVCGDLWEWDGVAWTSPPQAGSPGGRVGAGFTFDSAIGRCVLVGGADASNVPRQDIWQWDGAVWTQVSTVSRIQPSGRAFLALAFDPVSGNTWMFGDDQQSDPALWAFDGMDWQQVPSASALHPAERSTRMVYDSLRDRVVAFGGQNSAGQPVNTLWEFDGIQWVNRTPVTLPATWPPAAAGDSMGLTFDSLRGRTVLMEPKPQTFNVGIWEWDGSSWTQPSPSNPPIYGAIAGTGFDGSRVLLLNHTNGHLDGWTWDGTSWTHPWSDTVTPGPSDRSFPAVAYDASRGVTVFFGGTAGSNSAILGDVWEWNGTTWTNPAPSGALPPARTDASLVYDARRGEVLLFGGYELYQGARRYFQDLWAWDGQRWSELTPEGIGPPPRAEAALAFDTRRHRVVLFGGSDADGDSGGDTWTLEADDTRQPALQFSVHADHAQLGTLSGLRVRARCGATSYNPAQRDGARLLGWSDGRATLAPSGWSALAINGAAAAAVPPYLPTDASTWLDWQSTGATDASRFLLRDQALEFQCRPLATSEASGAEARVALDYIEARVQYLTW